MKRCFIRAVVASLAASLACTSNTGGPAGTSGGTTVSAGGTTGSSGGSSGGGILPLAGLLSAWAAAYCRAYDSCYQPASYLVSSCQASEEAQLAQFVDESAMAVDAGLLAYSPTVAQDFVQAVADAGCGFFAQRAFPYASYQYLTGLVANGGDCWDGLGCADGDCAAGDTGICPGTCTAYPLSGAPCSDGCGPSSSCTPVDAGVFACEPLVGQNGACSAGPNCQLGLQCVNGACMPPGGAGAACATESISCQSGLFCKALADGGAACTPQIGDGGACGPGAAAVPSGLGGPCQAGLACVGATFYGTGGGKPPTGGTCLPLVDVGGPCVFDGGPGTVSIVTGCRRGLLCVGGQCQTPPTSGPCASDSNYPCYGYGYFCDRSKTCVAQGQDGAACQPQNGGADCLGGLCVDGGCVTRSSRDGCQIP